MLVHPPDRLGGDTLDIAVPAARSDGLITTHDTHAKWVPMVALCCSGSQADNVPNPRTWPA